MGAAFPFNSNVSLFSPSSTSFSVAKTTTCTNVTKGILFALLCAFVFYSAAFFPALSVLFVISVFPGVFAIWLSYWWQDRTRANPERVFKCFVVGVFGILPIAIVEVFVVYTANLIEEMLVDYVTTVGNIFLRAVLSSFVVASLCEETFKVVALWLVDRRFSQQQLQQQQQHAQQHLPANFEVESGVPYSVMIYAIAIAAGLATVENLLYVMVDAVTSGAMTSTVATAVARCFLAVPLHTCTAALIGYDLAVNKFQQQQQKKALPHVLVVPFLLHGLYDFCATFASEHYRHFQQPLIFFLLLTCVLIVIALVLWSMNRRVRLLDWELMQRCQYYSNNTTSNLEYFKETID